MTSSEQRQAAYRGCVVLFSIVGCAFLWASLLSFNSNDWPSANVWPHPEPAFNTCGRAGAWIAHRLFYNFGDGSYPLALAATLGVALLTWRGQIPSFWQRLFGTTLIVMVTSVSVHLVSGNSSLTMPEDHGGILGIALGQWLTKTFSMTGTILVLAYGFFVGVAFTAEGLVAHAPAALLHVGKASGKIVNAARDHLPFQVIPAGAAVGAGRSGIGTRGRIATRDSLDRATVKTKTRKKDEEQEDNQLDFEDEAARRESDAEYGDASEEIEQDVTDRADTKAEEDDGTTDDIVDASEETESKESLPTKPPVKVVNLRTEMLNRKEIDESSRTVAQPYPKELGEWQLPPIALLKEPEYIFSAQQETIVREKAAILEKTLNEFRIEAHVVEIDTGPVITMYELQLAPGIKVSQISGLSNDIARSLKASAVRIVAPIPGKNTVGVEVPNADKEVVRLKELLTLGSHRAQKMALPLFLGKDASGSPLIADLASMPHMLIAGTTGSGKSVCINTIILSFLMTQRPDMLKLILVDPKMVEMSLFKNVPHLMCPIVTDMARAEKILDWAATKMDERYELLAEAGVRNIASFNRLTKDEIYARFNPTTDDEKAQIPTHLPHIVIIIDELADLMMTSAKEVEHHLSRLAQKSRAVGIHIIVATQRPEAKIVTGLIKSNLPCRMAFRVASRMDSRIVLDQNGAEVLLGQGDALFLPPGSAKLLRAQGTYLDDSELHEVINFLDQKGEPEFHPELVRLKTDDSISSGERDPLFDQAVRIVLESKRGSVSLLQRRLTVGYARASRLIEQMATAGIVGDYKGSQAREVVMTLDEWEQLRSHVQHEVETAGYAADQDDSDVPDLIANDDELRD